ncbi:hypothetical protein CHS0354_006838 [Potamilus streckersoni]|uniref:Uncharacterized protein n=1 Tax=Potamilus streckersoni TaxID=2493646 RepID=A0AAE0TEA0_9BIVA|nr:hypothetical protein CHS0354_006838 [Potamilus streckersoni]
MQAFRTAYQFQMFSVNTVTQEVIAEMLMHEEEYLQLRHFYQKKRDYMLDGLRSMTKFDPEIPQGTYFIKAKYNRIINMSKLPIKPSLPNDRRSNAVGRLRDIRAAADMITPVHTNNLRERAETLYEESLRHRIRDYDRQSRQFKKRMKNSAGYISAKP